MKNVVWHGKDVKKRIGAGVYGKIATACLWVEGDAKRICTEKKAVDTGRLRASITHRIDVKEDDVSGRVGTDVFYAPFVFLGTRFVNARPVLRPALEENRPKIRKLFGI